MNKIIHTTNKGGGMAMAITEKDEAELTRLHVKYKHSLGGRKQDYFAFLYLMNEFNKNVDELKNYVAIGGKSDYGVDAYYIDKQAGNLYLYQFKWTENHNLFKNSLKRFTQDGIECIFGNNQSQDPEKHPLISNLKRDIKEFRRLISQVYYRNVFKGDPGRVDNCEGLNKLCDDFNDKKFIINNYFESSDSRKISIDLQFRTPHGPVKEAVNRIDHFKVSFQSNSSREIKENDKTFKMHFGLISLWDLLSMSKELGTNFLSRNIRAGLSKSKGKKVKTEPARKMFETLNSITSEHAKMQPERFTFYHNGVTLVVGQIITEGDSKEFYAPRVLNGAQTITTLKDFEKQNKTKIDELKNIYIVARVLEANPTDDIVRHVTIANNQQNPIHPWNLRANDQIQCDIADYFKDTKGICYSRLENYFENLSDDEKEEMGYTEDKDIELRPFAQTLAALQGEIQLMSNAPLLFESDKNYKKIFNVKYLESNPGLMILLYKVNNCIKLVIDELLAVATNKNKLRSVVRRGKNLIWAILLQGIMNNKIEELIENYGEDLTRQYELSSYLKKMARLKILPLIKEIINRKEYKEKLKKDKLDFLRDRSLFFELMQLASKRYGWKYKNPYEMKINIDK